MKELRSDVSNSYWNLKRPTFYITCFYGDATTASAFCFSFLDFLTANTVFSHNRYAVAFFVPSIFRSAFLNWIAKIIAVNVTAIASAIGSAM